MAMIAVVYCKLLGSVNNIWGRRARVRHTQNFFRNFLVIIIITITIIG